MMTRWTRIVAALYLATCAQAGQADSFRPNVLDPAYDHDRWVTSNYGFIADFAAYRSSFDSDDDDDGFGGSDTWGVPEWVAYEVKRYEGSCIDTHRRPSEWITNEELSASGVMPTDDSYATTRAFRNEHRGWFARGHLAMKFLAERLGDDAQWNTHTFYNAVPQRQSFNGGIWLDLENLTGAWAQHFGAVWIVTGPIFMDKHAFAHLGEQGEFPVAIPEALFKIVIREGETSERPDVLAFIYPQVGPGYSYRPYDHTRFLTTVDEIEELTGLDFMMSLADNVETEVERAIAPGLWPADPQDFIPPCRGGGD